MGTHKRKTKILYGCRLADKQTFQEIEKTK